MSLRSLVVQETSDPQIVCDSYTCSKVTKISDQDRSFPVECFEFVGPPGTFPERSCFNPHIPEGHVLRAEGSNHMYLCINEFHSVV